MKKQILTFIIAIILGGIQFNCIQSMNYIQSMNLFRLNTSAVQILNNQKLQENQAALRSDYLALESLKKQQESGINIPSFIDFKRLIDNMYCSKLDLQASNECIGKFKYLNNKPLKINALKNFIEQNKVMHNNINVCSLGLLIEIYKYSLKFTESPLSLKESDDKALKSNLENFVAEYQLVINALSKEQAQQTKSGFDSITKLDEERIEAKEKLDNTLQLTIPVRGNSGKLAFDKRRKAYAQQVVTAKTNFTTSINLIDNESKKAVDNLILYLSNLIRPYCYFKKISNTNRLAGTVLDNNLILDIFNKLEKQEAVKILFLKAVDDFKSNPDLTSDLFNLLEFYVLHNYSRLTTGAVISTLGTEWEISVACWLYKILGEHQNSGIRDFKNGIRMSQIKNFGNQKREFDLIVPGLYWGFECKNHNWRNASSKNRSETLHKQIINQKSITDNLRYIFMIVSKQNITKKWKDWLRTQGVSYVDPDYRYRYIPDEACQNDYHLVLKKIDFQSLYS